MIALENILVATDFGEASTAALNYGRALARTFGATLHLVHVLDDVGTRAALMVGYGTDFAQLQTDIEDAARADLEKLVTDDDRDQLHAVVSVVSAAAPANAIIEY